ncbi:MAG: hypothetical protein HXY36_06385 [Chloroflexi bacterium]|nr:hypothetical protein [Chloroflexota bacterium]NWF78198.1 hypothetical protein [Chloroflexota bacterium]
MPKLTVKRVVRSCGGEAERQHHRVLSPKAAVEEAILKGQKSLPDLEDIPEPRLVSNDDLASPAPTQVQRLSAGLTMFDFMPWYHLTSWANLPTLLMAA